MRYTCLVFLALMLAACSNSPKNPTVSTAAEPSPSETETHAKPAPSTVAMAQTLAAQYASFDPANNAYLNASKAQHLETLLASTQGTGQRVKLRFYSPRST